MNNEINLFDVLIILAKHKWKILINFVLISVIALVFALNLTKLYKSEVVFIPKGPGGSGLFSLIGNSISADIVGSSSFTKRQYKEILKSRELREKLIKHFNLIEYFELSEAVNPTDKALKILSEAIQVSEEEEGSLGITNVLSLKIVAVDKDPKLAADMANYMYSLLEEKALELNTNEYREIHNYLSEQLTACQKSLDSVRVIMKDFQYKNHLYDIPQQVSLVLGNIGSLKAQISSIDTEISLMRSTFSSSYSGIDILQQKRRVLQRQLNNIEVKEKKDLFIGLKQSVELREQFTDLFTEKESFTQLRILLKQQLAQADIKMKKDFISLYLVDRARPAEYKFKPKRAFVIILIVIPYMFLVLLFFITFEHYYKMKKANNNTYKRISELIEQVFKR